MQTNDMIAVDEEGDQDRLSLMLRPPLLAATTYLVAVVGSKDQVLDFFISFQLYDCPNDCNHHGSCNAEIHVCTCEPDWDVANDCSVYEQPLTPGPAFNITVGGQETFYVSVDVPQAISDQFVDLEVMIYPSSTQFPLVYVKHDKLPTETDYDFTTSQPPANPLIIYVPHASLLSGTWYFGLTNTYANDVDLQITVQYKGYCDCEKGMCNTSTYLCDCDAGWMGATCDIGPAGASSGVDPGIVAFLVLLFLALGVVGGIFAMRVQAVRVGIDRCVRTRGANLDNESQEKEMREGKGSGGYGGFSS